MEPRGPSQTAIYTALLPAAHDLLDDAPKILADPFARDLVRLASDQALLDALKVFPIRADHLPRMRMLMSVRSRYVEDELGLAVERGISQYVMLGAGLDSFAFRRPDLMRMLHVFEVDHPASQSWKRGRVMELGIAVPPTLHYVPIDFERATLSSGLAAGGVSCTEKTFYALPGVTQYLSHKAVLNTLKQIASAGARGSELVAQFVVPAGSLSPEESEIVDAEANRAASVGEPWISYFTPEDVEFHLRQIGFEDIVHFDANQAAKQYLFGRPDGIKLPQYFHMVRTRIGINNSS
jgi:methyltransferase (TIGR00027 family)